MPPPEPAREALTILDLIGIIATALAIAVLAVFLVVVVPTLTAMLEEYAAELPLLTKLLIVRWPVALLAMITVGLLLVSIVGPGGLPLAVRRLCGAGAFGVSVAGVIGCVVAAYLPVFQMAAVIAPSEPLHVDLPRASSGAEIETNVVIAVSASGGLFIDGEAADVATLSAALREAIARDARAQAIIQADESVPYQRVVEVMDLVRSAGVQRIAMSVEAPAEP